MSGADKNDCASWCNLPADHDGPCRFDHVAWFASDEWKRRSRESFERAAHLPED